MAALTEEDRHERISHMRRLVEEGKTQRDLAAEFGISIVAVQNFMRRHNIKTKRMLEIEREKQIEQRKNAARR